jgi:hypothetical protein
MASDAKRRVELAHLAYFEHAWGTTTSSLLGTPATSAKAELTGQVFDVAHPADSVAAKRARLAARGKVR